MDHDQSRALVSKLLTINRNCVLSLLYHMSGRTHVLQCRSLLNQWSHASRRGRSIYSGRMAVMSPPLLVHFQWHTFTVTATGYGCKRSLHVRSGSFVSSTAMVVSRAWTRDERTEPKPIQQHVIFFQFGQWKPTTLKVLWIFRFVDLNDFVFKGSWLCDSKLLRSISAVCFARISFAVHLTTPAVFTFLPTSHAGAVVLWPSSNFTSQGVLALVEDGLKSNVGLMVLDLEYKSIMTGEAMLPLLRAHPTLVVSSTQVAPRS